MSISRHTGLNLSFNVLSLAVYLVTVPLYLQWLGKEGFGLLALIWLLVTYFRLFDFGLSRAVTQRLAALAPTTPPATGKTPEASPGSVIVWTALALSLVGGLAAALALIVGGPALLAAWDTLGAGSRLTLLGATPWLAAIVPIITTSATLVGALQGRQRFLEMNVAMFTGLVLMQAAPLIVMAAVGGGLEVVIPIVVLARASALLLLIVFCARAGLLTRPARFSRPEARQILRFGAWAGISSIVSPLMTALDRLVIAASRGPQAVPNYAVPFQLVERSLVLPHSLSEALFPRYGTLAADAAVELSRRSISMLAAVLTPIFVAGVFLFEPLLAWWLGAAFAIDSVLVGQLLILGFWTNALASIPFAQLQASGRPGVVARIHLLEVLPYLAFLWFALDRWGLAGAALAFGLRTSADLALLWRAAGLGGRAALDLATSAVLLLSAIVAARLWPPLSSMALIVGTLLVALALADALRRDALQQLRRTLSTPTVGR